jgi:hypothetical protein
VLGTAFGSFAGEWRIMAQEPAGPPAIMAISPVAIVRGAKASLRIRGIKLLDTSSVKFPGASGTLVAEIKEKKKAEVPNGLELKDVGDTQVEVAFEVPAEFPAGDLAISLVTPHGTTAPRAIRVVVAPESLVDEKEPNGGFREAQPIESNQSVRATIANDKDVDVFVFTAPAHGTIDAEVVAARRASLLDPLLTLVDAHGNILATSDDTSGRDAQLSVRNAEGGRVFVVVQDANDRGSAWHSYEFIVHARP